MSRQPRASLASLVVLLLCALPVALSAILPTTLPACAQQCTVLLQAQGSCESNPSVANSCFCQSSLLTGLKSTGSNICAPACSATDYATISNWYNTFCSNGANLQPGTATAAAPGGTTPTTSASAATSTAASAADETEINENQTGSEWWNTHWQWIVMVIVLILGFTAIGVGGRYFYRRHQRKKDGLETSNGAASAREPEMGMWAPSHHSVHDFGNAGPSDGQPGPSTSRPRPGAPTAAAQPMPLRQPSGKGKGRVDEPSGPLRSGSKRLRKAANAFQM